VLVVLATATTASITATQVPLCATTNSVRTVTTERMPAFAHNARLDAKSVPWKKARLRPPARNVKTAMRTGQMSPQTLVFSATTARERARGASVAYGPSVDNARTNSPRTPTERVVAVRMAVRLAQQMAARRRVFPLAA